MGLPGIGALIRLKWLDAYFTVDEEDEEDCIAWTFGKVLTISDKYIRIASEVLGNDYNRAVTAVPLVCVLDWEELT